MNYKLIFKTTVSGMIFTFIFILFVVVIAFFSKEKIIFNERQNLLLELNQIVSNFDNDILLDYSIKKVKLYGINQEVIVYEAKKLGKTFARLFKYTYPKGYSGNITLISAIDNNNKIIGTRILKHKETPGLGDKIEIKKSQWITSFDGLSITDKVWKVKKRGGDFDSWSGATVTPQAVVRANYGLLLAIQQGIL